MASPHPSLRLVLAAGLSVVAGCGGNARVVGDWAGDCLLETDAGRRRVPYTVSFGSQWQGELLGTGGYVYDGFIFEGDLRGTVEGSTVAFDLVGIESGYTVTLEATGDLQDNDDIEGTCSFFDFSGRFDMERSESASLTPLAENEGG